MKHLICFFLGHKPLLLNSTYYIVCERECGAVLNFRVSTRRRA